MTERTKRQIGQLSIWFVVGRSLIDVQINPTDQSDTAVGWSKESFGLKYVKYKEEEEGIDLFKERVKGGPGGSDGLLKKIKEAEEKGNP